MLNCFSCDQRQPFSIMAGHSHSCGHEHKHDEQTDAERANAFSLYRKIDIERVMCLNEAVDSSGKLVFKPWDERLDREKVRKKK